ncbi:CoA-transferase subunit beta [Georgenia sp. AZ-5]|uniref:CoA-transferase subunit beta n=1 Tax=Georgenia sp. AZ-5 TaxID=3367526 RepID=UPI003754F457
MADYQIEELLAVQVSRELKDGELGFIGLGTGGRAFAFAVGVPSVAAALAHRRGVDFIAQYGVALEPDIEHAPRCFEDRNLLAWPASAQIPVEMALDGFKRGKMNIGFLSGAQIDVYGNLNSVAIGDYDKPDIRLVGAIALPDHAANAERTIIILPHSRRTFVERVDHRSAFGYGDGSGHRERLGLIGGGPGKVFTDLAVLDFEDDSKRMRVVSVHPGVTKEKVNEETGFELVWPDGVPETPAPTAEELAAIREIDPDGALLNARIF